MPLVGEALAILNGVRAGQHDSVFVFPGGRRGKPLMSLYKPMMRLKRLSGIDGFYFHDLRRTARTGWVAIEIDDSLAERLLNHKDRGVQAVYNRHRYDNEKRAALVRWDRRVREIVKGEVLDKVVQLHAWGGHARGEPMQLGKAAADQILKIVHLLAKGADHQRLSPVNTHALNQNVEALIQHDGDDFVRAFLARVRDATGVLTPHVAQKLSPYP